jgi:hypothetical protein
MKCKLLGVMKMNELLLQSEYAEIIIELLKAPYNIDSVVKVVFLSFCIRNEKRSSYRNRKTDFVDVILNNINIKLISHPDELMCIFEALNKLKKCGWIRSDEGKITLLKDLNSFQCDHRFLKGCKEKDINPIIEVNKLDDKAFIEEVLRHV